MLIPLLLIFLICLLIAKEFSSLPNVALRQTDKICCNHNVHQIVSANVDCKTFDVPVGDSNETIIISLVHEKYKRVQDLFETYFKNVTTSFNSQFSSRKLTLVTASEADAIHFLKMFKHHNKTIVFMPGTIISNESVDTFANSHFSCALCEEQKPNQNIWTLYDKLKHNHQRVALITLDKTVEDVKFLQPLFGFIHDS